MALGLSLKSVNKYLILQKLGLTDTDHGPLSFESGQSAGAGCMVLSPGSWEQEKHQIQGALSSPGTTTCLFSLLIIWRAFLILKDFVRKSFSFREKTSLNLMENNLSFSVRKREREMIEPLPGVYD